MSSLPYLRSIRGHSRTQVTKKCTYVENNIASLTPGQKQEHITCLKSLKLKLDGLNAQVCEGVWEKDKEEGLKQELAVCDEYDEKISKCLALLETFDNSSIGTSAVSNTLKLPELILPEYSHAKGESIERFFKDFEDVTAKASLNSYTKLLYLQKQTKNEPHTLIQSLSSSDRTYEAAKELLMKAFGSELIQKHDSIKMLTELKLSYHSDPYKFISEMRIITDSFRNLNISTDDVLQFFFWNAMNESFKCQLTQIIGKSKPSLKEIEDNIFEATDRYVEVQNKFKEKRRNIKHDSDTTILAVNAVTKPKSPNSCNFKPCFLCSKENLDSNHPIYKCPVYNTPQLRIDKLNSLNACTKCANGHDTKECRFRFQHKCKNCNKWHFSFLCHKTGMKKDSKSSMGNNPSTSESNNSTVYLDFEALNMSICSGSILPTFTTALPDSSLMRCLKDSGSQMTFIETHIAEQQGLEVVTPRFDLVINGFNESRKIQTKIVKLPIKSKTEEHVIEAVCIPKIKTKLALPGLGKIVSEFSGKGYQLADQFLSCSDTEISNFGLLLGTDYDYCVPVSTELFGSPIPSVYLNSPFGIMISGCTQRMLKNLEHLPSLSVLQATFCSPMEAHGEMNENTVKVETNFTVINQDGEIIEAEMKKAIDEALFQESQSIFGYDDIEYNDHSIENHEKLVKFTLDSTTRNEEGRLVMPLMWNGKVSHLLGKNQNLSKAILLSNLKKYKSKKDYLSMIDTVFKEQEDMGIIERVVDLPQFLEENPNYSFLPHMPVFRMNKETTKCRVVYLSNLSETNPHKPMTVSHNQAMLAGPSLNRKISTAVLQLRFDSKLLCFDLKKAFLMIELPEPDQVRLLFYWFQNVAKEDFSIVVYKHVRLPFGLKPSPAILLLGLYKILILDAANDPRDLQNLKKCIYDLCYMDNCAFSTNDSSTLRWAFGKLADIFEPYKFYLQQFVTNDTSLQEEIDQNQEKPTPDKVKVLGLIWNREEDTIATERLSLDKMASTKRKVLRSIASNYDIFNINGPLLNRARLFMQELQFLGDLDWDAQIPADKQREWKNICCQVNSSPDIAIRRFVGQRGQSYRLIAFTDSSKLIYATVIYIQNLETKELNFLMSKSRLMNKQLKAKSIPCLEFQAITLGTEVLIDTFRELAGNACVQPVDVVSMELFTDSLVCLNWLNSHVNKIGKLKNLTAFVVNRLDHVCRLCEECPITFSFCEGSSNPADSASRPMSYRQLMKTTYFSGPPFLKDEGFSVNDMLKVTIPNPLVGNPTDFSCLSSSNQHAVTAKTGIEGVPPEHLFPLDLFSGFHQLVRVQRIVLRFINNCKLQMKEKNPSKYSHLTSYLPHELFLKASLSLIRQDQKVNFPDVFSYYATGSNQAKDMPNIVGQLNIFPDEDGILRVKSKCARWKDQNKLSYTPILLPKNSLLTKAIILGMHRRTAHAGVYTLLSELRKQFYVPHYFSTVKKLLKCCVNCRRFNQKTIKLNQSPYRDFRLEPPNIPYRYVFIDHLGPYWTEYNGKKTKVWLLCITCLWSRAVNLKICLDLTTPTFLRALQMHIHEYGMPEKCFSDMGSQIVSGTNLIRDFINDPDTKQYLEENGIKCLEFNQYFRGCNQLGSLVESCVKLVKRLIYGSIKNSTLKYLDFEFLISETIHLVNRRPVAFKEGLRDGNLNEDIPAPITPEILLKGYELTSLNIIPDLQPIPLNHDDWNVNPTKQIRDSYKKLREARANLTRLYNSEFLAQLISQATDAKSRYKPVSHKTLQIGDIVLIKDQFQKPSSYPMGRVLKIQENNLQEVTGATVLKGNKSVVQINARSLIPLLSVKEYNPNLATGVTDFDHKQNDQSDQKFDTKPQKRNAALQADKKNQALAKDDLI